VACVCCDPCQVGGLTLVGDSKVVRACRCGVGGSTPVGDSKEQGGMACEAGFLALPCPLLLGFG